MISGRHNRLHAACRSRAAVFWLCVAVGRAALARPRLSSACLTRCCAVQCAPLCVSAAISPPHSVDDGSAIRFSSKKYATVNARATQGRLADPICHEFDEQITGINNRMHS